MASRATTTLEGGRIAVPAGLLRELELGDGDVLLLEVVQGDLRVCSRDAVIAGIQTFSREYVPEGVSVVDELIADRRAEAARE